MDQKSSVTAMADPVSDRQVWRLSDTGEQAADKWADILARTHTAFDLGLTERTASVFEGSVVRRRVADLWLVDCMASPFRGWHDADVADEVPDVVGIQFVHAGMEVVTCAADSFALTRGAVVLWDARQAQAVEVTETLTKRTLIIPRKRLLQTCPRLADVGALPLQRHTAALRLLASFVDRVAAESPQLDPSSAAAASNALLELVRAVVEPTQRPRRDARREVLRAQVREFIRCNLANPKLNADSIAAANCMSVRALHALFAGTETTVTALVRTMRLARAVEDLSRPGTGTITEIAYRWGFASAAHFGRALKRDFGMTPTELRHEGYGQPLTQTPVAVRACGAATTVPPTGRFDAGGTKEPGTVHATA